ACFLRGKEFVGYMMECFRQIGEVLVEGFDNGPGCPYKNARVPYEVAAFEKFLRQFQLGLLGKGLHFLYFLIAVGDILYISISGFRAVWLDAQRNEVLVVAGVIDAFPDGVVKSGFVKDRVVGRRDDDAGVWIFFCNLV